MASASDFWVAVFFISQPALWKRALNETLQLKGREQPFPGSFFLQLKV
jgi:hypothetical protein